MMTPEQLVKLTEELRDLGVVRFSHGEFSAEFAPGASRLPERPKTPRDRVLERKDVEQADKDRERDKMTTDLGAVL